MILVSNILDKALGICKEMKCFISYAMVQNFGVQTL